ncbi:hypothetical protein [Flavobacterium sp. GCM10023249]|uniref:hypothetical protein n=1 Tax=unclassified Flavobacterium TaxID=196869 RepID=UPI00361880E2
MKKIILILFTNCFLSVHSQQNLFTLDNFLSIELSKLDSLEHGVHYMINDEMVSDEKVKQNLQYLKTICQIDLKKYNLKTIQRQNHTIRICEAINKSSNIKQIIEIVSVYQTLDKKNEYNFFNYYIVSNKKTKPIHISFDENGITGYQLGRKKTNVVREMIILIEDSMREIDIENKKITHSVANEKFDSFIEEIEQLKKYYFK